MKDVGVEAFDVPRRRASQTRGFAHEVAVATEVTVEAVTEVTVQTTMVERVTVSEHYLAVEYVPVHSPERRARPRELASCKASRVFGVRSPSRPLLP